MIYLISYPRSGRSWVRVLYLKCFQLYVQEKDPEIFYGQRNEWLPSEKRYRLEASENPPKGPTAELPNVKPTHDGQSRKKPGPVGTAQDRINRYSGSRVILLKRNPKDVELSFFNYMHQAQPRTLEEFWLDERHGLARIEEFYKVWEEARKSLTVKVIYYEDFHRDTAGSLKELLEWMSPVIQWKEEWIKEAVEFGRLENMGKIMLDGWDFLPEARTGRVGDGEPINF